MTSPRPTHLPARVLTLDQAYAFAYGDLRRRVAALAAIEADRPRRVALDDALMLVAERLELDLRDLLIGSDLAEQLARPE